MAKKRATRFTEGLASLKPPKPARSVRPTGPAIFALGQDPINEGEGPGDAPEGFVGGTTSLSEWYIYWALEKIRGPEAPGNWSYQQSFLGGRHIPGGAVLDFVVEQPHQNIGIRIQTYYFHTAAPAGSVKHAADLEQRISLEDNGLIVIDIYEQNFIHDKTGRSAIRQVIMALELVEEFNPRAQGLVHP